MDRLETIEKMLSTLLKHENLMVWIDCFAYGANNGGRFVSLFSSRANFRMVAVYEEQFHKLPPYVQNLIPEDCGGEISTERSRVENAGRLIQVPRFCITRWSLGGGDDQTDKWRFGDTLWVSGGGGGSSQPAEPESTPEPPQAAQAQPPAAKPQPTRQPQARKTQNRAPLFGNLKDAIEWAVGEGVFADYDSAKARYEEIKAAEKPKSAGEMYAMWIGTISKLAKQRQRQAA